MGQNAFYGFLFYIFFYTHFLYLEKYLETSQMQTHYCEITFEVTSFCVRGRKNNLDRLDASVKAQTPGGLQDSFCTY